MLYYKVKRFILDDVILHVLEIIAASYCSKIIYQATKFRLNLHIKTGKQNPCLTYWVNFNLDVTGLDHV